MKVLYVAASLSFKYGGPTRVITELAKALTRKGVQVSIFAPMEKNENVCFDGLKGVDVKLFPKTFFSKFWTSYSPRLAKALMEEVFNFDLIHIHEIWHYPHFAAYRAAKKIGKPYIITTHGSLHPWAVKYKGLKKKIFTVLIQRHILQEAAVIQVLTDEEIQHIRTFGVNNNIIVVPNGINPKEFQNLPPREKLEQLYPIIKGKQVILFLSRIHPKKGLDLIAKAFGVIARKRNKVCLLIVGPNSNGYQGQIEKMFGAEGVLDKVIFTGMLTGYERLVSLSGADIFVLPSYSEGFSISVLEAMACKLPIVITSRCNFPEIEEVKAGVVIEPDVTQLVNSLVRLLDNPQLCKEMGKNGQQLISEKFTWDRIADRMIELYQDTLLRDENI